MKPFSYYSPSTQSPSKGDYRVIYLYDKGEVIWKGRFKDDEHGYLDTVRKYPEAVKQNTVDGEAYRQARIAHQKEVNRLFEEFKNDLFEEFGVAGNPKRWQCFEIANDWSNGSGKEGIYEKFEILVELIK
jgi:hypothetical protein